MDNTSENLRFLLWKEHRSLPRDRWPEHVASWAHCSMVRAGQLLRIGGPTSSELYRLAEALHLSGEDLQYARLVVEDRDVKIWQENIKYLLEAQGRGGAARLAEALGVQSSTVSQWQTGRHAPTGPNLVQVCKFFHLEDPADLMKRPFFLSLDPVTVQAKREWVRQRVDALPEHELQELFPAFRRLLGDR